MGSLLLIDDEPTVLAAFLQTLARTRGYTVRVATSAADGLDRAAEAPPDVVLLDLHLPDRTGLDLYADLRRYAPRAAVVFVTASGSPGPVIEATKFGAFDYLFKPVTLDHLDRTVTAAFTTARATPAEAEEPDAPDDRDGLVGRCPAMRDVYRAIGRAAPQEATVLILGESGTGKELVARAVWQHSRRAGRPFVALNCAAIPEALLESELFGHEKGAFTGADRKRVGKFEQADGGTLFLDEIGDMPLSLQAKLLRVLQDGTFDRVGGGAARTDVRVIAATHQDLERMAEAGRFRRDLFFRLNVLPLRLPPLRDRGDDIGLLVAHHLRRFNRELDTAVSGLSPDVESAFRAYQWPGNVRELQSVLRQAMLAAGSGEVRPEHLPECVRGGAGQTCEVFDGFRAFVADLLAAGSANVWDEVRARVDAALLPMVLGRTGGNQQQAAQILGVARQTLRTRLRELGLAPTAETRAQ
jgi:two-component system nitrogen regulation response regulator GlnG